MTYPDVEALVYGRLGEPAWAVTTTNPHPHVLDEVLIQLDTRATTKQECRDKAWAARDSLIAWQFEPGAPIHGVTQVTGPRWLPDPDGTPRYVTQLAIRARQDRSS